VIIDASVLLQAFFPDEMNQAKVQALLHAHALGTVTMAAPLLLTYEIINAILQAVRRGRIELETAEEILSTFEDLAIDLRTPPINRVLALAHQFDRSAYDAAYLAMAEHLQQPLLTGDHRLYNAVQAHLSWVLLIDTYQP
jgi:predicted nucleic acid-binding protein